MRQYYENDKGEAEMARLSSQIEHANIRDTRPMYYPIRNRQQYRGCAFVDATRDRAFAADLVSVSTIIRGESAIMLAYGFPRSLLACVMNL